MPKRMGSRFKAKSRRLLDAWIAKGKPIGAWKAHGTKKRRPVHTHNEMSSADLVAWRRYLDAHPELRAELRRRNPVGTAEGDLDRKRKKLGKE